MCVSGIAASVSSLDWSKGVILPRHCTIVVPRSVFYLGRFNNCTVMWNIGMMPSDPVLQLLSCRCTVMSQYGRQPTISCNKSVWRARILAARLLVEPQNPNANSCCPRVPTKMDMIAPVLFELSCKQWKCYMHTYIQTYIHTYRTAHRYIPALPTVAGIITLAKCNF